MARPALYLLFYYKTRLSFKAIIKKKNENSIEHTYNHQCYNENAKERKPKSQIKCQFLLIFFVLLS